MIWTEERMDEVLAGVAGGIHAINVGPINVEMKRAINVVSVSFNLDNPNEDWSSNWKAVLNPLPTEGLTRRHTFDFCSLSRL